VFLYHQRNLRDYNVIREAMNVALWHEAAVATVGGKGSKGLQAELRCGIHQ